ncbi:transcriptional regulator [Cutibacterium acnes JCM 18920]|nr:transcriptional regulator [Cutibacterium acnes JCM 18920]
MSDKMSQVLGWLALALVLGACVVVMVAMRTTGWVQAGIMALALASSSPCSVSTTADTCDMSASGFSSPLTGRAPTMADVAKRAAVSPQTVSRVVRGQTNVSR